MNKLDWAIWWEYTKEHYEFLIYFFAPIFLFLAYMVLTMKEAPNYFELKDKPAIEKRK